MGMEKYANKVYAFTATMHLLLREAIKERDDNFLCRLFETIEKHMTMFREKRMVPNSIMCRIIYRQIDMFIEKEKPSTTSCRSGCAYCCSQFVTVSRSEAQHLLKVAQAKGIEIDFERAKRQARVEDKDWHNLPRADQPCVFLDTETSQCRVYRDRPLACRKYFVVGDPKMCDINHNPGELQPIWYQLDAELVSTAWMTVDGCHSLPHQLLQEVKNESNNTPTELA